MKYLCLVYLDEKRLDELPDEDCVDFDTAIRKSGHCSASEALESVKTAATVRVRKGKVSVTDGPFAETKEQLAGFYMIEAKDLNEAIQLASRIPPARVNASRPGRPPTRIILRCRGCCRACSSSWQAPINTRRRSRCCCLSPDATSTRPRRCATA